MSFKPFDIAVIIATVILLIINGILGVFSHWPPEQRPGPIRYFVVAPDCAMTGGRRGWA
jgi:hypothetical protein